MAIIINGDIGLLTLDPAKKYMHYSTNFNGVFFKQNANSSATVAIPTTGFNSIFSIATPTVNTYFTFQTVSSYRKVYVYTNGVCHHPNNTYYAPESYETTISPPSQGTAQLLPIQNPQVSDIKTFGKTAAQTSGFGLQISSFFSNTTVDSTYSSFYLQQDTSGNWLKSGTATSMASDSKFSRGTYTPPDTPMNVVFDKPYDAPPLIFIKDCTGGISLRSFTKNANGKYIGASVVARATEANLGLSTGGYGYYTANTYTFNYFIVSQEDPPIAAASHGIKVWSDTGSKVFDSSYITPNIELLGTVGQLPTPVTFAAKGNYGYFNGWVGWVVTFNGTFSAGIPKVGTYWDIKGNSTAAYNGNWKVIYATTSQIYLGYTSDPGTFGTGTTTAETIGRGKVTIQQSGANIYFNSNNVGINFLNDTATLTTGVCINPYQPFAGYWQYASYSYSINGTGTSMGPQSFYGQYLWVPTTAAAQKTAYIVPWGTLSLFRDLMYYYGGTPTWLTRSYDFNMKNANSMPYIVATIDRTTSALV